MRLFLYFFSVSNAIYLGIAFKACDRDLQCGGGMCCAVSLWIQSLRICTPMGIFGEDCHPLSHKVSVLHIILVLV